MSLPRTKYTTTGGEDHDVRRSFARIVAALAGAAALSATPRAFADACSTGANTVYVSGASAATAYLATLSQVLQAAPYNVQLVFFKTDSCTGDEDILAGTALTATTGTVWTASTDGGAPVASSCTAPGTGYNFDVGISDVYATTCLQTVTAGFQEFDGPIQAMALIVNANSSWAGKSISAEAAHIVFHDVGGVNGNFPLSPWLDPTQIWIREGYGQGGSGTRLLIGLAFDPPFLPANDVSNWSSAIPTANVVTSGATLAGKVASAADPDESLGIVATSVSDPLRTTVAELAFQGVGQTCGFYPDSNQKTAYDKINVREGRYQIWGPEHIITAVASPGDGGPAVPVGGGTNTGNAAAVQTFVNLFTQGGAGLGTLSESQNEQIIASAASAGFVSECAMRVRHTTGVDILSGEQSYVPTDSCGCYWDSIADKTASPAGCTPCQIAEDGGSVCSSLPLTPTCRYGFCEAN